MPILSLITATWNAADTLAHCLDSVAAQTVPVEHLLIDGGSSDGTLEIAERYHSGLARVVSEPDQGIYDAMNKGIALASGEVVGILNADDFYPHPQVLEQVLTRFENPAVGACYGDLRYVDGEDVSRTVRFWHSGGFDAKKFYHGWMPPHPTFFVRRSVYERFGGFKLDLGSAADYELMLRFLLRHGVSASYIPEVLVHMRTGGVSNASLKNRLKANRNDRRAWEENSLKPYPWTLILKPLRKLGQWQLWGHDT